MPQSSSLPAESHLFEPHTITAINAALGARRPLLVRGDPGVGKSQLARAAAHYLGRAFISFVVDSRTESQDLLYHFDAVQRLADAQIYGHTCDDTEEVQQKMEESNYHRPGPFWWAYDWTNAEKHAGKTACLVRERPDGWTPADGCTVLIDEIDKGEADVPNGLLEVLGAREFTPRGSTERITITGAAPLVIITTNAERILPDAFLRRCFVLSLTLPDDRRSLIDTLVKRAAGHFDDADPGVLNAAAELLADAREESNDTPRPGQAEFLDIVRAVLEIEDEADAQIAHLTEISRFAFRKREGLGT